jgi:hypothetical protein
MAKIDGATLLARALKRQGVEHMFGIVGFPVFGVANAAQKEGIRYIGFRNEQAASYAAGAVGYLTGRPGACLTVSGPGMVHGIAGLANAWANGWPMILLGAPDSQQTDGLLQECPQVEAARPLKEGPPRRDRACPSTSAAVRTSTRASGAYSTSRTTSRAARSRNAALLSRCGAASAGRRRREMSELALLREAKGPLVIVARERRRHVLRPKFAS